MSAADDTSTVTVTTAGISCSMQQVVEGTFVASNHPTETAIMNTNVGANRSLTRSDIKAQRFARTMHRKRAQTL